SDGTGLKLVILQARAVVDGPLAFTELQMSFSNPEDRQLEGRFEVTLPPGAALSRLAMKNDNGWQEAEVVELQAARVAYEDFLHRRQDPALLEKQAGNQFQARIFPIPPGGQKEILLSYSQELTSQEPYRLPLAGLPRVSLLDFSARVTTDPHRGPQMLRHRLQDAAPTGDLVVQRSSPVRALSNGELVLALVRPSIPEEQVELADLLVLCDTSASRAAGFPAQLKGLEELLGQLGSARVRVACFDQQVAQVYDGPAAGFRAAAVDREALGATDLSAALLWAAAQKGFRRVLLVTDGVATAGDEASVAGLGVERLDVLLVGGIRDPEAAARLVRGHLAQDGLVLDGDQGAAELARRLRHRAVSGVTVSVEGAHWVWPQRLDSLQPGEERLVYAQMKAGQEVVVRLGGPLSQQLSLPVVSAVGPLVERAAVRGVIGRLQEQYHAAPDREERERLRALIVEVSTRHRVVSDHTALLVLESEQDYARFRIDRRALADILVVEESGVEVLRRSQPTPVAVATPTPTTNDGKRPGHAGLANYEWDVGDGGATMFLSSEYSHPDGAGVDMPDIANGQPLPGRESGDSLGFDVNGRVQMEQTTTTGGAIGVGSQSERNAVGPTGPTSQAASTRVASEEEGGEAESRVPPYTGAMKTIMDLLGKGKRKVALELARQWHAKEPGDVVALTALGECLEALGQFDEAARAYGSILDLYPSRADLRRYAGNRLDRVGERGRTLAVDTYRKAAEQRADHPSSHRLLAMALLRDGRPGEAFEALEKGLQRQYPGNRFASCRRVLQDDLGLAAAAWLAREPGRRSEVEDRLKKAGVPLADRPSTRFVLTWETDANDVDFHLRDGQGGHAYYSSRTLPSGGALYDDVTTGYGPECFAIHGTPEAFPYHLSIHYYSRGPMGYGMGKVEVVEHDGKGGLRFDQRPFLVMQDDAFVDLGTLKARRAGR
ncbi:MAG: VIT domain-containing protein, partial [Candidatus Eremiobacterota bacterium]